MWRCWVLMVCGGQVMASAKRTARKLRGIHKVQEVCERRAMGVWRVLSGGWQVAFALHAGAGASWYDASALMKMPDLSAVSGSSSAGGGQQNTECGSDVQVLEQHECGEGAAGVWAGSGRGVERAGSMGC